MSKIKEMDLATAKHIRQVLDKELPKFLNEYGLSFELGNASYDDDSIKFNGFRLSVEGGLSITEKALKRELEGREQYDFLMSLDQTKIANMNSMKVKLVGFKPKARKKPFIVQDQDTSQEYIISEKNCEKLFGIKESVQSWVH